MSSTSSNDGTSYSSTDVRVNKENNTKKGIISEEREKDDTVHESPKYNKVPSKDKSHKGKSLN